MLEYKAEVDFNARNTIYVLVQEELHSALFLGEMTFPRAAKQFEKEKWEKQKILN